LVAFQIYDGVMQAVYEFLEREQPDVVTLVARGDGLKQAYSVYLDREHAALAALGYRVDEFTFRRS